jgi:hypothetical protein
MHHPCQTAPPGPPPPRRPPPRWRPLLETGQVTPAAAYLSAQRLRQALLALAASYFRANGLSVVAKPGQDAAHPGLDGLPSLLGMPELTLPVGFELGGGGNSSGGGGGGGGGNGTSGGGDGGPLPVVNTLFALPGADALVVAVGGAFQRATRYHLARPNLAGLAQRAAGGAAGAAGP